MLQMTFLCGQVTFLIGEFIEICMELEERFRGMIMETGNPIKRI